MRRGGKEEVDILESALCVPPLLPPGGVQRGFQHPFLWTAPQLQLSVSGSLQPNVWVSLALPPFHPQGRKVTSQHVLEKIRRASVLDRASEASDTLTTGDRCRSDPDKSALIPPQRAQSAPRRWRRRTVAKNTPQTRKHAVNCKTQSRGSAPGQ